MQIRLAIRKQPWVRAVIVVLIYGGLIAALWRVTSDLNVGSDFVEYWAAARLDLVGQNPYDASTMAAAQRDLASQLNQSMKLSPGIVQRYLGLQLNQPMMMYNPPWVLAMVMPVSLLPYHAALMFWLALEFAVVVVCSDACWRLYGGTRGKRPVAWLLGMLFVPTASGIAWGNISPFMLLGATAFMWAAKDGHWGRAGLSTVLLAIKPQVTYLFWPALVIWVLQERRWRLFLTGLAAGTAATAIPIAFNPPVLVQYIQGVATHPPLSWDPAVPALALRLIFGADKTWLQFVPSLLGLVWWAWRWHAQRATWHWEEQLPVLLLVSYATSAYGWTSDQVIFVPALMQVAVWILPSWRTWRPIWRSYLAANVLLLATIIIAGPGFLSVWHPVAQLVLYLVAKKAMAHEAAANGGLVVAVT